MKLIETIKDILAIKELKSRIAVTLGYLIMFRLGSYILLPGIDYDQVQAAIAAAAASGEKGILDLVNTFVGGAFNQKAVFALGIMPYISASIILQLMQVAVPYFQRLQKEGESGRKRINQITRFLTIAICLVQSVGFLATIEPEMVIGGKTLFFTISSMLILTGGTMFCMWLGEKITEKGIGNGISMLIMIGIISRLPAGLFAELSSKGMSGALFVIIELVVLVLIVMGVVMLTQATRRIPVNFAKQVVGNRAVVNQQQQYIPLKVNTAGVMPIIFAQSLMFIPALVAGIWEGSDVGQNIATIFSDRLSWQYNLFFAVMILLFTFFYTAIVIHPTQIADDLKRNGGFIPGVKPGEPTADYIDGILSKITFPGAVFIALVAILPAFAQLAGVDQRFADFYGGTGLLIIVGVVLETVQQIESYLLMRKYEGMMKSGKFKGAPSASI